MLRLSAGHGAIPRDVKQTLERGGGEFLYERGISFEHRFSRHDTALKFDPIVFDERHQLPESGVLGGKL